MEANHESTIDWGKLLKGWKDPLPGVIARNEVHEATGGLVHPRTLANMDSRGLGPKGRFRFNKRNVGYPMDDFIRWLNAKSAPITGKGVRITKECRSSRSN